MQMQENSRFRIVSIYLLIFGIVLAFWWPLSHWLYSDWYHQLMGFTPGSYADNMVKMIGTSGIVPVLLAWVTAVNPQKYRGNVIIMLIFGVAIAATNAYLILLGDWPVQEWFNVVVAAAFSMVLLILYPWRAAASI